MPTARRKWARPRCACSWLSTWACPIDLSTDIYLPECAAVILRERSLTPEQAAYLAAHTLANAGTEEIPQPAATQAPASQPTPAAVEPQPPQATHVPSSEALVKGKTTFAELLEWGVSTRAIEQVLGMPMPATAGDDSEGFLHRQRLELRDGEARLAGGSRQR